MRPGMCSEMRRAHVRRIAARVGTHEGALARMRAHMLIQTRLLCVLFAAHAAALGAAGGARHCW